MFKYLEEKEQAIQQLAEGSEIVQTQLGEIEVSVVGEGPAVLSLHGTAGGYDMGLAFCFPEEGFQFISVSRPGYLRTPLDSPKTPAEQADACAALLDELGIETAAVVGMSAGGPPSIEFALHYPERCWGLILVSAVSSPDPYRHIPPLYAPAVKAIISMIDFPIWLMTKSPIVPLAGAPKITDQLNAPPEKMERLRKLVGTAFPISQRADGIVNEVEQIRNLPAYPLEKIQSPTLVVHGDADRLVPFKQGQRSAEEIPNAEFLHIPGGSHLCFVTHLEETEPVTLEFLRKHAPIYLGKAIHA
jgi:pimeloyl-ACP methyl ester carboxylesterase